MGRRRAETNGSGQPSRELRKRLERDELALVDDHNLVDGLCDLGQDMAGDEHSATLVCECA